MRPTWLLPPDWPAPARVRSGCTLREGGVSSAPYASLNLGAHVGDDITAVERNRRIVRDGLQLPSEPLWLTQVHGVTVVDADRQVASPQPPRGDAAITRQPGRVLAVLIADCMPVLLCRRDGAAVAVAHAGWRGLCAGVLEATVAALGVPGDQLLAWLGPSIGPQHFEVGAEVRAAFCDRDGSAQLAFWPNARGRWQCDLNQLARMRLARLGLNGVYGQPRCTFALAQSLFSYRRDGVTGRFAALIWMNDVDPAR